MQQQICKLEGNPSAHLAPLGSFLDLYRLAHDSFKPSHPIPAVDQFDAILGKEPPFVRQHDVAFAVSLEYGFVEKNVRSTRSRCVPEVRLDFPQPTADRLLHRTF